MSLNKIMLSGRLGSDAQLRTTGGGTDVLTFGLAVSERVKQSDGSWGDYTNWIDCVVFGARARSLEPYMRRGSKVSLVGHVRVQTYEQEGRKRRSFSVHVDDIEFMNTQVGSGGGEDF